MQADITAASLRDAVFALPDLAAWPEVSNLFPPDAEGVRTDWRLPVLACRAAGGDGEQSLYACAAIACLQISIILVDDILDEDPRGAYHELGYGRAANLGLALQAAGLALIDRAPVPAGCRAQAASALARAALTTARGQDLDVQNLRGEENYWQVVRTKSTPFYAIALELGGLLAGAEPAQADGLHGVGALLGEIIQIWDDLLDAFAVPANPDWCAGRNNLAILYALTAPHPGRERLSELLGQVDSAARLEEAQQILITSGSVSYCVYLLLQRHHAAQGLLAGLGLPHPEGLAEMLADQLAPLRQWLAELGLALPPELAEPGR